MAARLDPSAPYEVEYEDVVVTLGGRRALGHGVPTGRHATGDRPALVDVHGGAWRYFDRKIDTYYNRGLEARGMVVVALDFRQAPDHQWPSAADDVITGVAWVRPRRRARREHAGHRDRRRIEWWPPRARRRAPRPLRGLCARALPRVLTRLALPLRARPHRQPPAFERAALRPGTCCRAQEEFFGDGATRRRRACPAWWKPASSRTCRRCGSPSPNSTRTSQWR